MVERVDGTMLLDSEESHFFHRHGYLHVSGVFGPQELEDLTQQLEEVTSTWARADQGWTGPWRDAMMTPEVEKASQLVHLHDLHQYSSAWLRAITHPRLVQVLQGLLGPLVEFHHFTLHNKPPETGHPFPMHQDHPFYPHDDDRFIAVLIHLDDTCHENGEIRFLDGSHRQGPLEHIWETEQGPCHPHLPMDRYRLEDTVAVPASAGDVVCFSINTVHGSYINTTDRPRRLVRTGFRHPDNRQIKGQAFGRPGLMVSGIRPRRSGDAPFS